MLIALWTGRQRTSETICFYFCVLANVVDEDEVMAHIKKLKNSQHNSPNVSPSCLPRFTLRRFPQRTGSTINAVLQSIRPRAIASHEYYNQTNVALSVPNSIGPGLFDFSNQEERATPNARCCWNSSCGRAAKGTNWESY
jgi:hypothetical protein